MLHTYKQKSQSRDELVVEARRTMLELADEMKWGVCEHPKVEHLMLTLSRDLKNVKGKKQYGYLSKPLKKQVDEIVDQMARLPSVQESYEKWLELQQQVNEFYSDKPMEQVPLSQQKEFRAIHNEEQLESQLDEAGQKILSEMTDAQQTVDHITALENFVLGFRLGARIMLECMDSGDGDTKEMIEHG